MKNKNVSKMKLEIQVVENLTIADRLENIMVTAEEIAPMVYDAVVKDIEHFLQIEERYLTVCNHNRKLERVI
jgi:hypothetical protein